MTTALLTGANRGIGLALARQLQARGATVIAAVRQRSPALDALGCRVETVEVTDAAACRDLARRLTDVPLDLLLHNAGLLVHTSLDTFDADAARRMFEINALAPVQLTAALRPNLRAGCKVGIVTSRMGSIADNTSGGAYGYRMSKAAVNAAGRSLAHDLAPAGVAVVLLHPGWVRTAMTAGTGNVDADEAAAGLLDRLDALTLETTGRFLHANGEPLPW